MWIEVPTTSADSVSTGAYGNGKFVVLGDQGSVIVVDATTGAWEEHVDVLPSASGIGWYAIAFNGAVFCAIRGGSGNATSATSPDGINWTVGDTFPALGYYNVGDLVWTGSRFVFATYASPFLVGTSEDGVSWTIAALSPTPTDTLTGPIFDGTTLFLLSGYFGGREVFASSDGDSWDVRTDYPNVWSVAATRRLEGGVVVVSQISTGGYVSAESNADASVWETIPHPPLFHGIGAAGDKYYCAQRNTGYVIASTDLQSWEEETLPSTFVPDNSSGNRVVFIEGDDCALLLAAGRHGVSPPFGTMFLQAAPPPPEPFWTELVNCEFTE